jgi:hypothetical protein
MRSVIRELERVVRRHEPYPAIASGSGKTGHARVCLGRPTALAGSAPASLRGPVECGRLPTPTESRRCLTRNRPMMESSRCDTRASHLLTRRSENHGQEEDRVSLSCHGNHRHESSFLGRSCASSRGLSANSRLSSRREPARISQQDKEVHRCSCLIIGNEARRRDRRASTFRGAS